MHNLSGCNDVIESFAQSCEELNDYSRHLWEKFPPLKIKTREGIRNYQSGWRLQKWVEAPLNESLGLWAEWWLQLGFADNAWLIESSVSISHSDFYVELPPRLATSVEALRQALAEAVAELKNASEDNPEFKSEVETLCQG